MPGPGRTLVPVTASAPLPSNALVNVECSNTAQLLVPFLSSLHLHHSQLNKRSQALHLYLHCPLTATRYLLQYIEITN